MEKFIGKQKLKYTFSKVCTAIFIITVLPFQKMVAETRIQPNILEAKISLEIQGESVEVLLKKIEERSNAVFVYSKSKIVLDQRISKKYTDKAIKAILADALPDTVTYEINDNKIILKKKEVLKNNTRVQEFGTISGTIKDTENNFLPYASVVVKEINKGTVSNINGKYTLELPAGNYTLIAQYIGYNDTEIPISVEGSSKTILDIVLRENIQELEATVVYGKLSRGQAKALNEQKNAPNVKTVVSFEQFSKYADRNAAEALQRMPGVSLSRDQGEGELISIRGLSPRFNAVQVNGQRVPSPDPDDDRAVGLDLLQADLMESIVVNKTLTPDMDGDAIGGTVNFNLKQAPDKPILNVSASGGFNQQQSEFEEYGKDLQAFSAVLGQRFFNDKLGIIAAGSYYRTNRGSLLNQFNYTDDSSTVIEEKRNNDYDVTRVRYGLMFSPDIRFDKNNRLKLVANYNIYDDDEIRRLVDYLVIDGEEERETRNRGEYQKHELYQIIGEHNFKGFDVSYTFGYTRAEEDMPFRTYWRFARDVDYSGFNNAQLTNLEVRSNPGGDTPLLLNRLRFDNNITEDENFESRVDVTIPLTLFGKESELAVGGKFRNKDRYRDQLRSQINVDEDVNPIAVQGGDFRFADVRADDPEVASLNLGAIDIDEDRGDGDDYEAEEDIQAGYIKITSQLSKKLSLVTGIRYERTSNKYKGIRIDDFDDVNEFAFENWLPSAQFKYDFTDKMLLRVAYSSGFTRPSFDALIPGPDIRDDEERRITRKNPELESSRVNNFDIIFEKYSKNLGVLSAGLFGKLINNQLLTQRSFEQIDGQQYRVTQDVNGENALALGVELAFTHKFLSDGIPFLQWFGVNANYTYAFTEQTVFSVNDTDEIATRTLPFRSPNHTANLGLFYDNPKIGLTFTISGVYRDAQLEDIGDNELNDIYFDEQFHLDISASQKLFNKLSMFLQLNNLTDQEEREVFGDPTEDFSRIHQTEGYGFWGSLGLRYEL